MGISIQEMAAQAGISAHTLRYYERAGLMARVGRDAQSGHRRYEDEDKARVTFLQKMRACGMPISELQTYVALLNEGEATLEARRQMLEAHRGRVCEQVAQLQDCLTLIEYKITNYLCLEAERNSK